MSEEEFAEKPKKPPRVLRERTRWGLLKDYSISSFMALFAGCYLFFFLVLLFDFVRKFGDNPLSEQLFSLVFIPLQMSVFGFVFFLTAFPALALGYFLTVWLYQKGATKLWRWMVLSFLVSLAALLWYFILFNVVMVIFFAVPTVFTGLFAGYFLWLSITQFQAQS